MFEGLTVAMVTPFRQGEAGPGSHGALSWTSCWRAASKAWWFRARQVRRRRAAVEERRSLWRFVQGAGSGSGPGRCGHRTNRHPDSIELIAARRGDRPGRGDAGHALLQQADPQGAGGAFHRGGPRHSTPDHPLQRSGPHRPPTAPPRCWRSSSPCLTSSPSRRPRGTSIRRARSRRAPGSQCCSGDDSLTVPMIAVGAAGVVSVAGNVAPRGDAAISRDHARARAQGRRPTAIHRLQPLFKALFVESNPGPVKFLLSAMGMIENELRLPLVPVEPATEKVDPRGGAGGGYPRPALRPRPARDPDRGGGRRRAHGSRQSLKLASGPGVQAQSWRGPVPSPAGRMGRLLSWSHRPVRASVEPGDVVIRVHWAGRSGERGRKPARGTVRVWCPARPVSGPITRPQLIAREPDRGGSALAANFSLGIIALETSASTLLSAIPDWDVEIVERHHRREAGQPFRDRAALLAAEVARRRGRYPASSVRHGREGKVGPRPAAEIGVHSIRGGTWVGDHAVLLAGTGESLELRVMSPRIAPRS